ncbi:MAG: enoyl-CoA hydratase/isomerase family protein [Alphaproteobacteria bacterium]|nr:enoyl-CoA hydratase/isomerase family protein [Alphaproteobacteria bacterium]
MSSVLYTVDNSVAIIEMNNPPLNFFNYSLRHDLLEAMTHANEDPDVQCLVIMGRPRLFCSGLDAHGFFSPDFLEYPDFFELLRKVESNVKPIIAAIEGYCFGGGLELALRSHFRVARPDAVLSFPEINLGIFPAVGGTQIMQRWIGFDKALKMCMSGKPVMASEFKDTGLFDVWVSGSLKQAALDFAAKVIQEKLPSRRPELDKSKKCLEEARESYKNSRYPAHLKIIDSMMNSLDLPYEEALRLDQLTVMELVATDVSKALVYIFFAETMAAKGFKGAGVRSIHQAAVIGAGTMGSGITMTLLSAGIGVTLLETTQQSLDRGVQIIHKNYQRLVQRGVLTEAQAEQSISLLQGSLDMGDAKSADLVIEAVFEDMNIKKDIFKRLDAIVKPGAILASNTSFLDINHLAAVTSRPQDVVGLHYFSPAHIMKLLEIVQGDKTSPDVMASALALAKKTHKIAVISGVCDGFIANRMSGKMGDVCYYLLEQGASPEEIDRALEDFGFAMGHFRVSDMAGNDVFGLDRKRHYAASPSMKKNVLADKICDLGRFGQKTGAGWYRYEEGSRVAHPDPFVLDLIDQYRAEAKITPRKFTPEEIVERCVLALINEGARVLEEGIALRASDVDVVHVNGNGFPRFRGGPMYYADRLGVDYILKVIHQFAEESGADKAFWRPSELLQKMVRQGKSFADLDKDGLIQLKGLTN